MGFEGRKLFGAYQVREGRRVNIKEAPLHALEISRVFGPVLDLAQVLLPGGVLVVGKHCTALIYACLRLFL